MATKRKKPRLVRVKTDASLKNALVAALQRDARGEQTQINLLGKILGEISLVRALLEHEANKYNLPALLAKSTRPRKRKASK